MNDKSASKSIDIIIEKHDGWKSDILSYLRGVILKSNPNITEEVKWKTPSRPEGLPVWVDNGIVCFAETWKDNVKLLFPKGAKIEHDTHLFNARLKSASIRAIELREGQTVDANELEALIKKASELNV